MQVELDCRICLRVEIDCDCAITLLLGDRQSELERCEGEGECKCVRRCEMLDNANWARVQNEDSAERPTLSGG